RVFGERVASRSGDNLRNAVPVSGRRFGAGTVRPEQCDLGLLVCACRADCRTELFDLLVVISVLLAVERWRARRSKLRAAAHSKRHDESPLRQQIRKKQGRSWHPHARTTPARWLDDCIGTIISARREDLVGNEFTPHDASGLLRSFGNCSENCGMKRIEDGCASRE